MTNWWRRGARDSNWFGIHSGPAIVGASVRRKPGVHCDWKHGERRIAHTRPDENGRKTAVVTKAVRGRAVHSSVFEELLLQEVSGIEGRVMIFAWRSWPVRQKI